MKPESSAVYFATAPVVKDEFTGCSHVRSGFFGGLGVNGKPSKNGIREPLNIQKVMIIRVSRRMGLLGGNGLVRAACRAPRLSQFSTGFTRAFWTATAYPGGRLRSTLESWPMLSADDRFVLPQTGHSNLADRVAHARSCLAAMLSLLQHSSVCIRSGCEAVGRAVLAEVRTAPD